MNCYPADEQWISDVERGRCCRVTVSDAFDSRPVAGDVVLFAVAHCRPGEKPQYVRGGNSVQVALTEVVELGESDFLTGEPLFRFSWSPLGQLQSTVPVRASRGKSDRQS